MGFHIGKYAVGGNHSQAVAEFTATRHLDFIRPAVAESGKCKL